jgi:hypothetical protein
MEQLRSLIVHGYLVFQDYAIANWSYHLRAMVKGAEELLSPSGEALVALLEIDEALREFAARYEDDFIDQNQVQSSACEAFNNCQFFSVLEMITGHVQQHQEKVRLLPTHESQHFANSTSSSRAGSFGCPCMLMLVLKYNHTDAHAHTYTHEGALPPRRTPDYSLGRFG